MLQRVAVTGAAGRLGRQLVRAFERSDYEVLPLSRPRFDISREADLARIVQWQPAVVVNAAAWTDVDGCARDPGRAELVNGRAAGAVAAAAARADALIVQISTNEVFDGDRDGGYGEDDEPRPVNAYGASKLLGERLTAQANPRHLIVRTAWLFGPSGGSFATKILAAAEEALRAGRALSVVSDEWGNPTWSPSLADSIVTALADEDLARPGILHLAGSPPVSRHGWAQVLVDAAGIPVRLEPIVSSQFHRASRPPLRAVLRTVRSGAAKLWDDWRPHSVRIATVAGSAGESSWQGA